jgi:hypothetical protein
MSGAPDGRAWLYHCAAMSGVHRTALFTVRCVHDVFLNNISLPEPEAGSTLTRPDSVPFLYPEHFLHCRLSYRPPLTDIDHRRSCSSKPPWHELDSLLPFSEQPLPLSSLLFSNRSHGHTPLKFIQISVKSMNPCVVECPEVSFKLSLQVTLFFWEVLNSKIVISPPNLNLAHQVLDEMPKPVKLAQIDPNFFQHTPATTSTSYVKISHLSNTQGTCYTTYSSLW